MIQKDPNSQQSLEEEGIQAYNQHKNNVQKQQQIQYLNKASIFNFILFVIFLLAFYLFTIDHNDHKIMPIYPNYFQDQIYAGQIHYSRIPVEYWQHRILMSKSMGLNTLSVYVMWNHHQIEKGVFDYQNQNKNLTYFLELSQKHNMKVLFRPGPYVCAQWDLGGLPARLLSIENISLRSSDQKFMNQVQIYFQSLAPIIRPYIVNPLNQSTYQNSITMIQIQNQYGFYGTDKSYILKLRQIWKRLDIICQQYYVDWIQNIKSSSWQNANTGINNGYSSQAYNYVAAINKNGKYFGGEIYSGWFKKWGEDASIASTLQNFMSMYEELLKNHHSFSIYVVHGGTNFGLSAGANNVFNQVYDYKAMITSYDYEAPISQNGRPTQKYFGFRDLIQKYLPEELPQIPLPIQAMSIQSFKPIRSYQLFSFTQSKFDRIESDQFFPFELQQLRMFNGGIVVYQTTLQNQITYQVQIQVRDFGILYVNHQLNHVFNRSSYTRQKVNINCGQKMICKIHLFVEAMGHINFGRLMETDYKGLMTFNILKNQYKLNWTMHKINLKDVPNVKYKQSQCKNSPCLFQAQFNLTKTHDTFINMANYQKGYVWVNGHNLGRYWNIGPQYRLYCPGVWLKKGTNHIQILDLLQKQPQIINSFQTYS